MSVVSFQDAFSKLANGYELTYWLAYRPEVESRWTPPAYGGTFVKALDGSWTRDYISNLDPGTVLVEVFVRSKNDGERTRTASYWAVDAPASVPPRRVGITLSPVDWRIGRLYERSDVAGEYLYIDWEFQV